MSGFKFGQCRHSPTFHSNFLTLFEFRPVISGCQKLTSHSRLGVWLPQAVQRVWHSVRPAGEDCRQRSHHRTAHHASPDPPHQRALPAELKT